MVTETPERIMEVAVSDNSGDVKVAGRDIVSVQNNFADDVFQELSFEEFENDGFVQPDVTAFLEILREHRLLILGGLYPDKLRLARIIMWVLRQSLAQEHTKNQNELDGGQSGDPMPKCRELRYTSASFSITTEIRKEEYGQSIFHLPRIHPASINYDLPSLRGTKHFILITTDTPRVSWGTLEDDLANIWQEPSAKGLYPIGKLARYLQNKVKTVLHITPEDFVQSLWNGQRVEQALEHLAERLFTPVNVDRFLDVLAKTPVDEVTPETLDTIIQTVLDDTQQIEGWFRRLSDREKLLAIGLSFFSGLPEDSCFDNLERVVEDVWQKRDTSLSFLDYSDLENLRNHFEFVPTQDSYEIINSRSEDQRFKIISAAWTTHRRQIVTALPTLADIVTYLAQTNPSWTLQYAVVADTITDVGRISPESTETALLILVASNQPIAQTVAAYAMASWRKYDLDDQLFRQLKNWTNSSRLVQTVRFIVGDTTTNDPLTALRSTVVLTLGYAARFDTPNQIDNRLLSQLDDYAADSDQTVRQRFATVVELLLPSHFGQLKPYLEPWIAASTNDYVEPFAKGLAAAFDTQPYQQSVSEYCLTALDAIGQLPSVNSLDETTERENLMALGILTFGHIAYAHRDDGAQIAQNTFQQVLDILRAERHPFVRDYAIRAVAQILRGAFIQVQDELPSLRGLLDQEEYQSLILLLFRVYLGEREKMEGGDKLIQYGTRRYHIWLDEDKRPRTNIEKAITDWEENSKEAFASKIAADFRSLRRQEWDTIEQQERTSEINRRRSDEQLAREVFTQNPRDRVDVGLTNEMRLAIYFATLGMVDAVMMASLRGNLPSLLNETPEERRISLDDLRREGYTSLARHLRRAVWWHNTGLVLFVIVSSVVVLLIIAAIGG